METTTEKPLLRPRQVQELKEEVRRLEQTLSAPPHILAQVQDPREMRRQLNNAKGMLETQAPQPYQPEERDAALAESAALEEKIRAGMPTHAEMRRNPAGARDKHRRWERRTKPDILKWKNVRLRQHATGMLDELDDASDIANVEMLRPHEASHELNMHNEQIPGKMQFGPEPNAGPATVFSDEDKAALKEIDPELADQLALMNNDQRAAVKAFMQEVMVPTTQTVTLHEDYQNIKHKKTGGEWTPERRKAHGDKVRAAKAKNKEG